MKTDKGHVISVKFPQKSPIEIKKQTFTNKLANTFKRYERIEEVAGRPIDEILLENQLLMNRKAEMNEHVERLNDEINRTKTILNQLIEVELALNQETAELILIEYQLSEKENRRTEKVGVLAEALRKIRYYYHPSIEEWVQSVERAKRDSAYYQEKAKQLEKENEVLKSKMTQLETKEGYKLNKVTAKGIRMVVADREKTLYPSEEKDSSLVAAPKEISRKEPLEEKMMLDDKPKVALEGAVYNNAPLVEQLVEKPQTDAPEDAEERNMMEELKKPYYMQFLDRKGYEYIPSKQPYFDVLIKKDSGDVPLMFIDYFIQQTDIFDEVMNKTNQIYFLFDNKENMKKGNTKFTSWLLKSKEKRKKIQFSFTTVDELKVSGLDDLDSL